MIRILRSEHPEYDELQKIMEVDSDFTGIEMSSDEVYCIFGDGEKNNSLPFSQYFDLYPQEEVWLKKHFPEAFI